MPLWDGVILEQHLLHNRKKEQEPKINCKCRCGTKPDDDNPVNYGYIYYILAYIWYYDNMGNIYRFTIHNYNQIKDRIAGDCLKKQHKL